MMTLWPGSYQDREEAFNFAWNAAIEVRPLKLGHEALKPCAAGSLTCAAFSGQ